MTGLKACRASEPPISETSDTQFGEKNGEFWAKLAVMDESSLVEFDKPADQIPKIVQMSTAQIGDRVALRLLFAKMQLTEASQANVTFDIEVLSPDGLPYDGGVHQDIPAIDNQVQEQIRFNIFSSAATLILHFKDGDQFGLYKIKVIVRDNIGNREIVLKEEITLKQD